MILYSQIRARIENEYMNIWQIKGKQINELIKGEEKNIYTHRICNNINNNKEYKSLEIIEIGNKKNLSSFQHFFFLMLRCFVSLSLLYSWFLSIQPKLY